MLFKHIEIRIIVKKRGEGGQITIVYFKLNPLNMTLRSDIFFVILLVSVEI